MTTAEQLTADIRKLATLSTILEHKLERLRCEGVGVEQELLSAKATLATRQEELALALQQESEAKP
jgi:hypothetical protein